MKQLILFCCLLAGIHSFAQQDNQSPLAIDQIMQGEDFVGYLPSSVEWSDDNNNIFFSWNPAHDTIRSTYKVNVNSKKIDKLTYQEIKNRIEAGDFNQDFSKKVFEKNGDLFMIDLGNMRVTQITNTLARESNPTFSGDEKSIIFQSENNLFVWGISDGSITQLTDFKEGRKRDTKSNKQDDWLEADQLAFFEVLENRKNESEARKYRNAQSQPDRPKTIYYGDDNLRGMVISPDLRFVVYKLSKPGGDKNTIVPDYVTQSGYTTDLRARSKVGGESDQFESWILDLQKDTSYRIETKGIEGIYDKPKYAQEYAKDSESFKETYDEPRAVSIDMPVFLEDGKAVVNITSQDYKDRWIMSLDLSNGMLKILDRQHDDAWIGGPGVGWFARGRYPMD